jgi:hypothetical protein
VAWYDTPGFAYDVAIAGKHAYVADGNALLVLDIETPYSPREVGRAVFGDDLWGVSLGRGNYACVADEMGDLYVVDISSDTSPQVVGHIQPSPLFGVNDVIAEGNYAYCTTYQGDFCIVNISKPESLFVAARLHRSSDIWQLAKYGNYIYAVGYIGVFIFDVSVPEAPVEVGCFHLSSMHSSFGPYFKAAVNRNLLYFSDGDLRILDLTNPTNPADVRTIPVYSYVYGVAAQDSLVCFANEAESDVEAESLFVLVNDVKASVSTRLPGYSIAIAGDYIYLATGKVGVKVYHLEK